MSSRADKALKGQKDKHHAILRELVQEVPNKTCAECLAKGPRWASWSLGVFVCIRCAGIHRNLGVHISKMKSIDLDSWTQEQLQNMLKWGNKRAAEYFECYLPKDFVRPQTNHALESFIRNKYEKKLYIKKDGEPESNSQSKLDRLKSDQKDEKQGKEKKTSSRSRRTEDKKKEVPVSANSKQDNTILNLAAQKAKTNIPSNLSVEQNSSKSHSMNDLLSLSTNQQPPANDVKHSASANDLLNFGSWSEPVATSTASNDPFQQGNNADLFGAPASSESDPFQNNAQEVPPANTAAPAKSTKESILSLYSTGNVNMAQQQQQQQMYGVPGSMYMPTNFQGQGFYGQPNMQQNQMQMNQMSQMNQMNAQMQQMNVNPQMQHQKQQQQMMMQNQMMSNQMQPASGYPNGYNQPMSMYHQQQQPQNMMNRQMNNMQGFGSMGQPQQQLQHQQQQQQQQGMMGNNWGSAQQTGMMGMGQQQNMMSNGNNFGMNSSMANTSNGNTMNDLLWN